MRPHEETVHAFTIAKNIARCALQTTFTSFLRS